MVQLCRELPFSEGLTNEIRYLVEQCLKYIPETKFIILFGSHVRGTYTFFSDIDLAVVTDEKLEYDRCYELISIFDDTGNDVVFYTAKVLALSNSKFAQNLRSEGVIIWEA